MCSYLPTNINFLQGPPGDFLATRATNKTRCRIYEKQTRKENNYKHSEDVLISKNVHHLILKYRGNFVMFAFRLDFFFSISRKMKRQKRFKYALLDFPTAVHKFE